MSWLPFKSIRGRLRITTNCSGVVATIALTLVIFGTLLILKYAAPLPGPFKGRIRDYYIAAEEVPWDYTPLAKDPMTGSTWNGSIVHFSSLKRSSPLNPPNLYYLHQDLDLAVGMSANRIGHEYLKARYIEYTSDAFDEQKPRPAEETHLGLLGPIIRAEVGDLIRVTFRNRCSFPTSIHPHALFYLREDEGVPMNASVQHQHKKRQFSQHENHGSGGKGAGLVMPPISAGRGDGNSVQPGYFHVYEWQVPARAGPGESDLSSIAWPYHSHIDETVDVNTGLSGVFIITRTGSTRSRDDLRPKDVDREYVLSLSVIDENVSYLLNRTMADALPAMSATQTTALLADSFFQQSNMKHAMNGYLYNNMPSLVAYTNETVRWHVLTLGDEKDLHGVHWHGATVLAHGERADSLDLIPGMSASAEMQPDTPGEWMVHCHTSHHFKMGMTAMYTVVNPCATLSDANAPCPRSKQ